jgi:hypothetical protein
MDDLIEDLSDILSVARDFNLKMIFMVYSTMQIMLLSVFRRRKVCCPAAI